MTIRAWRRGIFVLLAVGLLWCADAVAVGSAPPRVRLAYGSAEKFRWWVDAYRQGSRETPCLQIELRHMGKTSPLDPKLGETSCRPVSALPNAFGVVDELDHPNMTVIAIAVPQRSRWVVLYFHGRLADRKVALQLLSPSKVRKTRVQPFRYAAVGFRGRSCLSRFVTLDGSGDVIFDGGPMRCWV